MTHEKQCPILDNESRRLYYGPLPTDRCCCEAIRAAVAEERERCANAIPLTWLHPLLTGPNKVLPAAAPYDEQDIERLLRAIAAAIRETP